MIKKGLGKGLDAFFPPINTINPKVEEINKQVVDKVVDNVDNGSWVKVNINDDVTYVTPLEIEENIVPDVKGMNATDAVCLLEGMGWKVVFTGYGKVKTQSVKPNTELEKGSVINLSLSAK